MQDKNARFQVYTKCKDAFKPKMKDGCFFFFSLFLMSDTALTE